MWQDLQQSNRASRAMSGKVLVILALTAGVMLAALLAVPVLLSTEAVRDLLVRQVEKRTGLQISTQQLDLRLLPRPGLDARHVRIFDGTAKTPFLTADRMEFALQIVPLFAGLIVGDYAIVERPQVTVRRDATGRWTMGLDRPEASHDKQSDDFDALTMVRRVLLTDGVVTIVNDVKGGQAAPLRVVGLQATLAEDMPGRTARVQVSGEIPHQTGSALFTVEGALLLVQRTGGDGETAESDRGLQIEGTVRVHRFNLSHLAGWLDMPQLASGFGASAQLAGRFRFVPRRVGYDLMVTDLSAGLSELALQGTARLTGLGTEAAYVSATVSASSIPLKQTVGQLPKEWLPEEFRQRFEDYAVDGVASLYDTHVEGSLTQLSELNVTGGLDLRDGRFVPEVDQPAVRDLSATIAFDLEQIRITGLRAHYGPVRLSDGTVLVTDWRREPMADGRISAEARAADLIALTNGTGRFPQVESSLAQFDQVTGEVRLDAHAAGRPMQDEVELVEASLTIRNLGFRHTAVAVPFRQIDAKVNVSSDEIRLEHLEGQAGPARVEAGGRVVLSGTPAFQDFTLKATADGDAFAPWLRQMAAGRYTPQVDGLIMFTGFVMGQVETPRFNGTLTLDGLSVNVPNIFTKTKGAPAGIRLEAEVSEDRMLSVRRAELIVPPVRLTGEGRLQLSEEGEFRAKIVSEALSVEKLPRGVTLGPLRAGILRAGLTLEGRAGDRSSWHTTGKLRFGEGIVQVDQLADPLRDLTVGLRFDGKDVEIRRLSFRLGESDLRISGAITNWLEAPQVKLLVESSQIDVESLLPRQTGADASDEVSTFSVLRTMGRDAQVEATFLIDHVFYQKFLLTGLSCRLRFAQGVLTVDRISSDTGEGHLRGRLVLNLSERGLQSARTAFRASGIPVERLSLFTKEPPQLTGWLRAGGKIQADFGQRGLRRSSVNSRRPITILVEDGRIHNVPVLANLLSIMNLPALLEGKVDLMKDGMPLDRLKAVFTMEDGILQFKELLLDSPILKISGTGLYDYIGDKFDAVIVASPLGQYSDLLKGVPLFGRLFAGERQGFDTAIFELKGSAKDPKIVYLPAESLMAGVKGTAQLAVDLLVNAITLPAKVYSDAEDLLVDDEEP